MKSTSARGVDRVVFVVVAAQWWTEIQKEIQSFKDRLQRPRYSGLAASKYLWLPSVVNYPSIVRIKIFDAISVRTVSPSSARSFANTKTDFDVHIDSKSSYTLKSVTGRSYKLQFTDDEGSHYLPLSEWSVVVIQDKSSLPRLKVQPLSRMPAIRFEDALCMSNNAALFVNPSDAPDLKVANTYDEQDDDGDWR